MSEKISKRLSMAERFVLLNNLPREGDFVTFKILRKLRETLSPDEAEIKDYDFQNSYRCPHREFDGNGRGFQCEVEATSNVVPKCHIHDVQMVPTGRVSWSPDKWNVEKEVWFGPTAHTIIVTALKKIGEEDKRINDDIVAGLYEKFVEVAQEETG